MLVEEEDDVLVVVKLLGVGQSPCWHWNKGFLSPGNPVSSCGGGINDP